MSMNDVFLQVHQRYSILKVEMEKQTVIALSLALLCLVHGTVCESSQELSSTLSVTIAENVSVSLQTEKTSQNPPAVTNLSEDSVAIATNVSNDDNQPLKSKMCEICVCQEGSPFIIDCAGKGLKDHFLYSDWPIGIRVSSIEVNFDNNNFGDIPQFPELPITKLSYRANEISFISKGAFKYLKELEQLDLSENRLTRESIGVSIFEGPFNEEDDEPIPIRVLKLGYNMISSIDKDAFNHLSTHLEDLELNNNPIKIDHQTAMAITTLRKLKVIILNC